MIFPKIECDQVVQVNDKFRIDCSKSYISKDEDPITKVEIEPEAGAGFIEVQGTPISSRNFWLDWEYQTAGTKVISCRITTEIVGPTVTTVTKSIECLSEADDKLLSSDSDLVAIESDILKYVPEGRSSFNYVHRESQNEILDWLFTNGYMKADTTPYTIDDIINVSEFKFWSKYSTLRLLYEDFSKAPDDVFMQKAKRYENMAHTWRHKSVLHIDANGDGVQGTTEGIDTVNKRFIRA